MIRITRLVGVLAFSMTFAIMGGAADAQTTMPSGEGEMDAGRGMAEVTMMGGKISIDYGRPEMKGRDMLAMAPAGHVWRFGSNKSTTFTTEVDLMFGDMSAPQRFLQRLDQARGRRFLVAHPEQRSGHLGRARRQPGERRAGSTA